MKPIVYLAITSTDRPIVTTCATLETALAQVADDLTWSIIPVAFDIDGQWVGNSSGVFLGEGCSLDSQA